MVVNIEMCTRTDLEDVEGLELDVATLAAEEIHHALEVLGVADVAGHNVKIGPV